jgi:hypothetical protein
MGQLPLLGAGGSGGGGPTVLLKDTFTDADGTTLPSHTMDVGGGWTARFGTFFIQGNAAQGNSDNDADQVTADAGHGDFTLTCEVTPAYTDTNNWERPGLLFRWTVADTNEFILDVDADGGLVRLFDIQSGVFTVRGSSAQTIASGSTHTAKVVASGTSLTIYWDGASIITYTSSFNQTATQVGLRLGKLGTSAKCKWDNLQVTT